MGTPYYIPLLQLQQLNVYSLSQDKQESSRILPIGHILIEIYVPKVQQQIS